MSRRSRIVLGAVLAVLVLAALGGPLLVLLVLAFVGLVALGDNLALSHNLGWRGTGPLRRQEVLRRHLGPSRPPESLTAEPYDEQAWAREWVRAQETPGMTERPDYVPKAWTRGPANRWFMAKPERVLAFFIVMIVSMGGLIALQATDPGYDFFSQPLAYVLLVVYALFLVQAGIYVPRAIRAIRRR